MNKGQSTKSMKFLSRVKILSDLYNEDEDFDNPSLNLESYLPMACTKLECEEEIVVIKEGPKDDKSGKINREHMTPIEKSFDDDDSSDNLFNNIDGTTIVINTVYDDMDRLIGINMNRVRTIPRVLIQLLAHVVRNFTKFHKISITNSSINPYVIYELKQMLPFSNLTDICLDNSPLPEGNYGSLLEMASQLRNLSLSFCTINDQVCEVIASNLTYKGPAEKKLMLLNLSSNRITDIGAAHFGLALRTNRHLRYLNLCGNRITDEGANSIFKSLKEFPLTAEETYDKRSNYNVYLKDKHAMYLRMLNEIEAKSVDESVISTRKKNKKSSLTSIKKKNKSDGRSSIEDHAYKALMLANEFMGPFEDPFSCNHICTKEGWLYCKGNRTLCYLNLAYNDLTFVCLKNLQSLLLDQSLIKKHDQAGLMKVVLDGNNLPDSSRETITTSEFLNEVVSMRAPKEFGVRIRSNHRLMK